MEAIGHGRRNSLFNLSRDLARAPPGPYEEILIGSGMLQSRVRPSCIWSCLLLVPFWRLRPFTSFAQEVTGHPHTCVSLSYRVVDMHMIYSRCPRPSRSWTVLILAIHPAQHIPSLNEYPDTVKLCPFTCCSCSIYTRFLYDLIWFFDHTSFSNSHIILTIERLLFPIQLLIPRLAYRNWKVSTVNRHGRNQLHSRIYSLCFN